METIFADLSQTTTRLNRTADAANQLIQDANQRLLEMGAGVSFSGEDCLRETPRWKDAGGEGSGSDQILEDAGCVQEFMYFGKIHGKWQLGIEEKTWAPGPEGEDYCIAVRHWPLLNAEREIRIEAAFRLPGFLQYYSAFLAGLANKLNPGEGNE